MSHELPLSDRSQSTVRSSIMSHPSKDAHRQLAGIASRCDFPHAPGETWVAAAPVVPALYSYNPIIHTVDKFIVDSANGKMIQYKTNRVSPYLESSAKDCTRSNRRKGVIEYADLTRSTAERWSNAYHKRITDNPKAFCHTPTPFSRLYDVAVRNHENPFRVGK